MTDRANTGKRGLWQWLLSDLPYAAMLAFGLGGLIFTSFRGFGEDVPANPWTYRDLRAGLDGVLNGWGNVYQIDMTALRSARQ